MIFWSLTPFLFKTYTTLQEIKSSYNISKSSKKLKNGVSIGAGIYNILENHKIAETD